MTDRSELFSSIDDALPRALREATQLDEQTFSTQQGAELFTGFFPGQEIPQLSEEEAMRLYTLFPSLIWNRALDFEGLETYLTSTYLMLHGASKEDVAQTLANTPATVKKWLAESARMVSGYVSLEELLELAGYHRRNGNGKIAGAVGASSLNGTGGAVVEIPHAGGESEEETYIAPAELSGEPEVEEELDDLKELTDEDDVEVEEEPTPRPRRRRRKGIYESEQTSEEFWKSPIPLAKPTSLIRPPSKYKKERKPLNVEATSSEVRDGKVYKVVRLEGFNGAATPIDQRIVPKRQQAAEDALRGLGIE